MTPTPAELFEQLEERWRETERVRSAFAILYWDRETKMPPGAADERARQMATLEGLAQRHFSAPESGRLLDALENGAAGSLSPLQAKAVAEFRRSYDRSVLVPESLVRELAEATSRASGSWKQARREADFSIFLPALREVLGLVRRKAELLAKAESRASLYDALLDRYEPGMTSARLKVLFADLSKRTRALLAELKTAPNRPSDALLYRDYDEQGQWDLSILALQEMGFDFNRGYQDKSTHPFTESADPTDVRVTTRIRKNYFKDCFYSTLHEGGHALYEQGLRRDKVGPILAKAISQGMHESQARLWENIVGLSRGFWAHWFPKAQALFPETLQDVEAEGLRRALNAVQPSFIRVDADEATYNLHVILRFELEEAMIEGALDPADLPARWNEKFEESLGIVPPSDAEGCLQDPHWSAGAFGYFPTYALGNVYSAPIVRAAEKALGGDLDAMFARGEFLPLKEWLNREIHEPGRSETAAEIVERVSGEPLSIDPLMDYLETKYRTLYGLA